MFVEELGVWIADKLLCWTDADWDVINFGGVTVARRGLMLKRPEISNELKNIIDKASNCILEM